MERIIGIGIILAVEIHTRHVHAVTQRLQGFLNFAGIACTVEFGQCFCIVQQDIGVTYLNSRSLTTVGSGISSRIRGVELFVFQDRITGRILVVVGCIQRRPCINRTVTLNLLSRHEDCLRQTRVTQFGAQLGSVRTFSFQLGIAGKRLAVNRQIIVHQRS